MTRFSVKPGITSNRLYESMKSKRFALPIEKRMLPMQNGDVPATHADTRALRDWVDIIPATAGFEGP